VRPSKYYYYRWVFLHLVTDSPIEVIIGTLFLYQLLGKHSIYSMECQCHTYTSCRCIMFLRSGSDMFVPANEPLCREGHRGYVGPAPSVIRILALLLGAQENLMKARDERVALMNEVGYTIFWLKSSCCVHNCS
jgi:hypothetical protein